MPFKRSYTRRKRTRRTYKKRYARRTRHVKLGFPSSRVVKLRFVQQFKLDATADIAAVKGFRANGPYDPQLAAGGLQPLGYDQWTAFYDHYVVLGSMIKVMAWSTSSGSETGSGLMGSLLSDTTSTPTLTHTNILEQGKCRYKPYTTATGSKAATTSYNKFSCKKFFGLKDVRDNRGLVGAGFGTTPTEEAIFWVFCLSSQTGLDPTPTAFTIQIDYIIMFSEPKLIAAS